MAVMLMNNIEAYWSAFKNKNNITTDKYSAFAFGWPESMQNELAELVKSGIKTATTSAFELYEPNEEIPLIGEYNIILDGWGNPVCITQTKVVETVPFNLISQEHAFHEGEGDRSYDYWRKVHEDFFNKEFKENKKTFKLDAPCICEVFELVFK
ncbi:hypothetical protein AWRIB318_1749 [Oenococcus oeni AWRIB318]|nr:hypothetical protein AWRIB318_1749 [Oenococcus oeni AWRIB318]